MEDDSGLGMRFQSRSIRQLFALAGCGLLLAGVGMADEAGGLTTGSKPWKMADGSTQRLRLVKLAGDRGEFQAQAGAVGKMPLSLFAPEEQKIFTELEAGSLKLVATPGLNLHPDMPPGKITADFFEAFTYWIGEKRSWQRKDGKKLEACLINLTEDRVSLIVRDTIYNLPIADLSVADHDYLSRLKRGEARMYAERVDIGGMGYGGTPAGNHIVSIPGEHYAALSGKEDFEKALQAVMDHVGSRLKKDEWSLDSFTEERTDKPIPPRSYHAAPVPAGEGNELTPPVYVAEIKLKNQAVRDAERHWPASITPRAWNPQRQVRIYATADGLIIPARIVP
jgi:hypothetical protein